MTEPTREDVARAEYDIIRRQLVAAADEDAVAAFEAVLRKKVATDAWGEGSFMSDREVLMRAAEKIAGMRAELYDRGERSDDYLNGIIRAENLVRTMARKHSLQLDSGHDFEPHPDRTGSAS